MSSITKRVRLKIKNRDGNKCLKCSSTARLTIDHIIPLSKGGTSAQDNLQTLCFWCNNKKDRHTVDYRPGEREAGITAAQIAAKIRLLKKRNTYLQ